MKNKTFLIAIGIVLLFGVIFFSLGERFKNKEQMLPQAANESLVGNDSYNVMPVDSSLLIKSHSPVKGASNPKVTVVEFLDPECEACAAMYPIVKKIVQEHKSNIKLVVRYMTYHQNSKFVANILESTRAQNKYWEALELLFQTQDQWANHQNPNPDLIPEILKPLKLNLTKIIADAKSGKYDKQIMEDFEDGKKVGVSGTPTFYVNGSQLQDLGYDSLKSEIESRLNQN